MVEKGVGVMKSGIIGIIVRIMRVIKHRNMMGMMVVAVVRMVVDRDGDRGLNGNMERRSRRRGRINMHHGRRRRRRRRRDENPRRFVGGRSRGGVWWL